MEELVSDASNIREIEVQLTMMLLQLHALPLDAPSDIPAVEAVNRHLSKQITWTHLTCEEASEEAGGQQLRSTVVAVVQRIPLNLLSLSLALGTQLRLVCTKSGRHESWRCLQCVSSFSLIMLQCLPKGKVAVEHGQIMHWSLWQSMQCTWQTKQSFAAFISVQ
jgi:hypothetical protein